MQNLFLRPKNPQNRILYKYNDQYKKNENKIKVRRKLQGTALTETKTTLGTLFTLFQVIAFYRPTYICTFN